MSAADVTRAAFASGVSPTTWAKLVRTATGGAPYHGALYGPEICETLLSLLAQYTTSPTLLSYLSLALGLPPSAPADLTRSYSRITDQPLLPLYVYVQTLLQTLGTYPPRLPTQLAEPLCRLALLTNQAFTSPALGPPPTQENPLLAPAASPLPLIPNFVLLLTHLSSLPSSPSSPPPSAAPELLLHTLAQLQPDHQIPSLSPSEKAGVLQAIEASSVWADRFVIAWKGLQRVLQLVRLWEGGDVGAAGMGWGMGVGVGVGGPMGGAFGGGVDLSGGELGGLLPAAAGGQQPGVGERDKLGPSLPLMSLVLSSLVENRATPFGSSSTPSSLALLHLPSPAPSSSHGHVHAQPTSPNLNLNLNILAESASTHDALAQQTYFALLQAAVELVAMHPFPAQVVQGEKSELDQADAVLWRAFVLGRLPALLSASGLSARPDDAPSSGGPDASEAKEKERGEEEEGPFERALAQVFGEGKGVLDACNPPSASAAHAAGGGGNVSAGAGGLGSDGVDEEARPPSFRIDLLRTLTSSHLLSPASATRICPSYTPSDPPLTTEAAENMSTPSEYIEDRLSSASSEDALAFLSRMEGDWRSHSLLASWFSDRLSSASKSGDLEQTSAACRLLTGQKTVMDIISLWIPVRGLVESAAGVLEGVELEGVSDPQSALALWGEVVVFVQWVGWRYGLTPEESEDEAPNWSHLLTTSRPLPLTSLSQTDKTLLSTWLKALFSPTEGIDDPMLRSTDPASLLRLATTFFHQAILARSLGVIDSETLQNGVGYFLSGLLSWTLVGVVQYLTDEAERQGPYSSLHFEILHMILTSESCPKPVLAITGASVLRLLTNTRLVEAMQAGGVNVQAMRDVVNRELCTTEDPFTDHTMRHTLPAWSDNCESAVREAFTQAQMNKLTTLDVERYLSILRPKEFCHIIWDACLAGASMGAMDGCRIVTSWLLSGLRSPTSPPLLPYFLLVFVPGLLADLDRQSPQQSAASMDTLVTIIVSACHLSFQLERSFLKVTDGAPLSIELRSRLQPRIWLNALLDRLETASGSASRLLSKRLHVVLND